jgi:hypothetical protein
MDYLKQKRSFKFLKLRKKKEDFLPRIKKDLKKTKKKLKWLIKVFLKKPNGPHTKLNNILIRLWQ